MSLLERVLACRRHDLTGLVPFVVDDVRLGWVRPRTAEVLQGDASGGEAAPFRRVDGALGLDASLVTPEARTRAIEVRLASLRDAGRIAGWRGEHYPVVEAWGAPEAFRVERAAAPWLGVRAFGVHVNAWVAGPRGPLMWVARRSRTKPSHPGKLDHLVAGGQPAGLSLRENLAKEAMEEAGVPSDLAARARAVAPFRYRLLTEEGLRDDTLFVYDLELPRSFEPRPLDGEVEQFRLVPADEVADRLRASEEFKYNVGPCIVGFLLRQGVIGARDAERAALLTELGPAVLEPSVPEGVDVAAPA